MRAVVQRVSHAAVTVGERTTGAIGQGVLILLGITHADTTDDGEWLAQKIAKLRIFPDEGGNMNRSLLDTGGDALVVSQFTLHARVRKGTRPSFNDAAPPAQAEPLYETFRAQLSAALGGRPVPGGEFGAMMQVALENDGPVTLIVDTKA
ncbi:D-aminoacyl-tRNA deacylase [Actomonas aquatica]|uniref:D-aminoacyl-tRNA deacylase n=1 Tax=Actomonas aquatica TaxID=2866162 RepID=A0ABZ1CA51_9BACT|nr:D-aminoacyl-tRNA deacylase [Opitutus sp. WL0086]WRQ88558.1 D-aminoacyl-tRNA deacylase [Opitutus sp. WL0086]